MAAPGSSALTETSSCPGTSHPPANLAHPLVTEPFAYAIWLSGNYVNIVAVEGEDISPEDYDNGAGWLPSHRQRRGRTLTRLGLTTQNALNKQGEHAPENNLPEIPRRRRAGHQARQPRLPQEDIKVVLRPRNGLDVSKVSEGLLRDTVLRAAGITATEAVDDILRSLPQQNLVMITYTAPPDNTSKGVIHNIPYYDTADDITRSLVYSKNPTVLQARRMGKTNSVLIVFDGPLVPFYVYYRGAEHRCFIPKKKHEVCMACGKVGHRADVCPHPSSEYCKTCHTTNPPPDHACSPRCALCGKDHLTWDRQCRQRYKTPFIQRQRQWANRRHVSVDSGERTRDSSKTGRTTAPPDVRLLVRDDQFPCLPVREDATMASSNLASLNGRRSRSKTRATSTKRTASRSPSANGSKKNAKVSWANQVSHSPTKELPSSHAVHDPLTTIKAELTQLKQMLEILAQGK
ncbi:hypothetical protein HPB48_012523 [Haemaphysalis longicornis]|uniref:CCHC-type domain-containing protein n=1 Tax=Haemaphysalis longicornis TaxID=44386 RepID=A0A9J6G6J7_HAELO|nr:hypothetical protein HPB48_012523 [Haemaphysalis longicornis]